MAATGHIIGRETELALLADFLDNLPGQPRALLVEGEAGIGKTVVWRAGLEAARERGLHVLSARASASDVRLSFAGLGDLVSPVLGEVLPRLPVPQRKAVEAALLLREAEGRRPDRRAVGLAFLSALRVLAREHPTVVAVDDLQWLDLPSARVLEFALRRLEAEPVGLLAAVRASPGSAVPFGLDRAFIDERMERVSLPALTLAALYELLRTRLGVKLPRPALLRIHEASGGNPFYALEIGRELERREVRPAPGEPLPIPVNLRALLHERVERLPRRVRELLLAASLLSNPTAHILVELGGGGQQVERDLERALSAGVIEVEGESVRFSHPLLAAAARAEASPLQRRAMHRRIA
ncbi:MAG: AAA family ATPase, partial [Actinomycetota bacterium]|nr:AAA family ATPase [Actinomycetota bacterium]